MSKPCPHPEKRRYATKARARQAAGRLHAMGAELRMRAYRCRCGEWHLTKQGVLDEEIAKLMHAETAT